ncbi:MAG: MFS transporter, partial [Proteobacteria bacterium]|nr:MFS transporter [Pseudomonadota bacterium]
GYRIGMLMAGAGAFVLATYFPWDRVYLIGAGVMLAFIPITLAVRKLRGVEETEENPASQRDLIEKRIAVLKEAQLERKEAEAHEQEQIDSGLLTYEQIEELAQKQRERDEIEAREMETLAQLEREIQELCEESREIEKLIQAEGDAQERCEKESIEEDEQEVSEANDDSDENLENVIPDADSPAPEGDKEKENFFVTSIVRPLTDFFKRPGAWVILSFIALFKLGDAMAGTLSVPFYLDIGFTKVEIAAITKVIGVIAVLGGTFMGGFVVKRMPILKALWFCGILQLLSNFVFVWLAHVGASVPALTVCICVENVTGGMGTAAFVAYISQLCNVRFTATQYALLSSLSTVGRTVFSSSAGVIVDGLGWSGFYISTAALAVPGLCMLYWLGLIEKKECRPY